MALESQDLAYREPAELQEIRRFRLDPVSFRARARRATFVTMAIVAAVLIAVAAPLAFVASGSSALLTLLPPLFMIVFFVFLAQMFRRQGGASPAGYELLVSPRVLRRVASPAMPAEVLRPEVTRIVETGRGLWVVSERPRRTLFVSQAVDGYADVRAAVERWKRIERLEGYAAWRFALAHAHDEGSRDARAGTALEGDPTLSEELAAVRAESADRGAGVGAPVVVRTRWRRMFVLWTALIFMFLAIWQFLSPAPAPRPNRPPTRPVPASTP